MDNKNSFYDDVYEVTKLIPAGRVTSYGAIASYLGSKGSARMVGWALNQCHRPELSDVPAHRVLNRNGLLSGQAHFGEAGQMQKLLEAENVIIKGNQAQDFKKLFWDPAVELA